MPQPRDVLSRYLSPGQMIAQRYQLQHLVGEGAYGAIYSALDTINHYAVAVKALPPVQENTSSTALGRFKREMGIIHSLVHPNIVALYDYGETPQGVPYMVMEYIKGQTLEACVRHKPMSLEDGLDVFFQIASALGAAHALGIIHRDLKPANIMVTGGPGHYQVKMLDFGMAKVLSQLEDETVAQITREGMAVGTPRYIAPEQARGLQVGPYTDLYALGLLGYEIFTGERAVKHHDIEGAVMAHVSPTRLPLPELDRVPAQMHGILLKLMEKDPARRYQLAEHLLPEVDRLRRACRFAHQGGLDTAHPAAKRMRKQHAEDQALDIDYDRLEQAEQVEKRAKQEQLSIQPRSRHAHQDPMYSAPRDRAPGRPLRVVEYIVAPLFVLVSFTVMTAQVEVSSDLFKAGIGVFPFVVAGLAGWLIQDKFPAMHPGRCTNIMAVLCFIGAHLLPWGPLKTNLMMHPFWYLDAVKTWPVIGGLVEALTTLARFYVELLSWL